MFETHSDPMVTARTPPLGAAGAQRRELREHATLRDGTVVSLRQCFTAPEGDLHFAIECVCVDGPNEEERLGVARLVDLPEAPGVAEMAVTVADAAHGKGIGTLLGVRLAQAARERGVRTLRAIMMSSNHPMKALMHKLDPTAITRPAGSEIVIDARLSVLSRY